MAKSNREKVWEIVKFLPEMNSITTEVELRSAANYITDACAKLLDRETRNLRKSLEPFGRKADAPSLSKALGHITREDLQRAKAAHS